MAALWKLPMIFCIENNQYGMGTSIERSSSNTKYYTMGNRIPGIRMDGMNVVAVREGMNFVKDYVSSGTYDTESVGEKSIVLGSSHDRRPTPSTTPWATASLASAWTA
jgi:hypothetical protein